MTAAPAPHPTGESGAQFTSGPGWTAVVTPFHVELRVQPIGDPLPAALDALFSKTRQRYWDIIYSHVDVDGWDVFDLVPDEALAYPSS